MRMLFEEDVSTFDLGLKKLGFDVHKDILYDLSKPATSIGPQMIFHVQKARSFEASAIFVRQQLGGSFKVQAYLFDFTNRTFIESELTTIQKRIWSSGEAPMACIFYNTEIKIIDCSRHVNDNNTPVYLINRLALAGKTHKLYNEQFAFKLRSGLYWEENSVKKQFRFVNSAYDVLIRWIQRITKELSERHKKIERKVINKIMIQSVLIKYLEERQDDKGNRLFSEKYFHQYAKSDNFTDVLRSKGKFAKLLEKLDEDFNGNIFHWSKEEKSIIKDIDLGLLADALSGKAAPEGQIAFDFIKYYDFNYVPVELISRLYEEFLGENKQENGLFYTPSHLAKLLVDEAMPLTAFDKVDLGNYKILDPACGSGIFLVVAFKRLVQWWWLQRGLDGRKPTVRELKKLLKCLYGIDKEQQAIQLTAFSLCLALCDELNPLQIISELKFDDLKENNLQYSDYFINELADPSNPEEEKNFKIQKKNYEKISKLKFDLVIGNPPFGVGALKNYQEFWRHEDEKIKIPQGQIALKFLCASLPLLKDRGLQCLIIKSSGLLYNSSSEQYKKVLFSNLNVIQILDFTALGRNNALWDNGADVSSAAIFLRKEPPDFKKNILHLTFRRTKATKERIVFEIDEYDLHFVNRQEAIENNFIWKHNLLGGGRISNVLQKIKTSSLKDYLKENHYIPGEGFKVGSKGKLCPPFIYKIQTLPTEAINENEIGYGLLKSVPRNAKFEKIPDEAVFTAPNIIIKENIGKTRIPIHLNTKKSFSFQHKVIGISHPKGLPELKKIMDSFEKHNEFYRFFIFVTSGQVLVNLNTAILKADVMNLPFLGKESKVEFSEFDKNVITDVNEVMQSFIRHGEGSKAVKPIMPGHYQPVMTKYGSEFSKVLNLIYENKGNRFRLSEVLRLNNSFIATVFTFDSNTEKVKFSDPETPSNIIDFSNIDLSKELMFNRIIRIYPKKNTIIFVKPNQLRYWLTITAYRDADKCFSELSIMQEK